MQLARILIGVAVATATSLACGSSKSSSPGASPGGASSTLVGLMKARGLSEADVEAALKTYTPTGKKDEYLVNARQTPKLPDYAVLDVTTDSVVLDDFFDEQWKLR